MLTGVTLSCFVLSYLIALGLELSRLFVKMPWRMAFVVGFTALGLIAHILYLIDLGAKEYAASGPDLILATWYDWSLLASAAMSLVYLVLVIRRPETSVGMFILPLILVFIALSLVVESSPPFDRATASRVWRSVHGIALLLGTTAVTLGFSFALMYLYQARRLKLKQTANSPLRLPSLEYLEVLGRSCRDLSVLCIAVGLGSGVVMNLQRKGFVVWTESGIVFSAVLLIWLIIASLMQFRTHQRNRGRQTAWLNIVSFVIVAVALVLVVVNSHGRHPNATEASRPSLSPLLAGQHTSPSRSAWRAPLNRRGSSIASSEVAA